jgi:methionyl-tRNA formyltransferase
MKLIFMGTPQFAVPILSALNTAGHQIVAVYTQPPRKAGRGHKLTSSPIQIFAEEHRIKVHNPISLRNQEVTAEFAAYQADAAVVASYGLIIPKDILIAPKFGCINIHPSLLPRWRGAAPIERTVLAGDNMTGVCIMQMDEGLDTGPILNQRSIHLTEQITSEELYSKLATLSADLLLETLQDLSKFPPTAQAEFGTAYAHKLTKEEGKIEWNQPAINIDRMVRALNPKPGTFFSYKNEQLKLLKASYDNSFTSAPPGTVVDENLAIACSKGIIYPHIIQRTGKKPMAVSEFLKGFMIQKGAILS